MSRRDQISAVLGVVLSLLVCIEAFSEGLGTFRYPGSGFMPFLSGAALGTFSVILIVTSSLRKSGMKAIRTLWKEREWGKALSTVLSLIIYAVLLPHVGYLLTTFGLMAFLLRIAQRSKLWTQLLIAFVTTVVTYVVFYQWLGVQLPKGIFGL